MTSTLPIGTRLIYQNITFVCRLSGAGPPCMNPVIARIVGRVYGEDKDVPAEIK